MCEYCGSMRPTYPGFAPGEATPRPATPSPSDVSIPVCGGCGEPLRPVAGGLCCANCRQPARSWSGTVAYACPKCRVRLEKRGQADACPRCGGVFVRP